jgi:hypothetical protein
LLLRDGGERVEINLTEFCEEASLSSRQMSSFGTVPCSTTTCAIDAVTERSSWHSASGSPCSDATCAFRSERVARFG